MHHAVQARPHTRDEMVHDVIGTKRDFLTFAIPILIQWYTICFVLNSRTREEMVHGMICMYLVNVFF